MTRSILIQPLQLGSLTLQNNVILAPMAGVNNTACRLIHKRAGAALLYSEMISANGLIRAGSKTWELVNHAEEERPFTLQLFGDDPAVLAEAVRRCQDQADCIDINMGCPVRKVIRSGAGSALLRDPAQVSRIVRTVRQACQRPLTIKIRSGWDLQQLNFTEIATIVQDEGADALILHPRTRCQGFGGQANWNHFAILRPRLHIPLIASGDIFTAEAARHLLTQQLCDAVMIGRGGYGNPWLIRDILALDHPAPPAPPSLTERGQTALEHLELNCQLLGERQGCLDIRKHLCWYARGIDGASDFRLQVNSCQSLLQLRHLIHHFFLRDRP